MKRVLLILLLAAFLVGSYYGYAAGKIAKEPAGETPTLVSPALTAQLNLLRDNVQPGTAGSSLRAASAAADLLDWAESPPPQENIEATVAAWLSEQSGEALERLPEQLDSVRWAFGMLTEEYEASAALMADAGLTGRGPWSDAAGTTAAAVLELLGR